MHRFIRIAAVCGIALLAFLWTLVWVIDGNPQVFAGTRLQRLADKVVGTSRANAPPSAADQNANQRGATSGVSIGGPFTLVDSTGKTVTEQDFRGRWLLIYFGYTYCPDVCPTELQTMVAALANAGPAANQVVPIFITVDPARDTPAVVGQYVEVFDPKLVGLTGSAKQIADVAKAYRVYYAKATTVGTSDYLMDHSSFVYLMNPQGKLIALYNPKTSVDDMAIGLREHVSQRG